MATVRWRGDAQGVAQVDKATPANAEPGDIFNGKIGNKTVSFTATTTVVDDVVRGFVAAWNTSAFPEISEITAAAMTSADIDVTNDATETAAYVRFAADTPGKEFVLTTSTTNASGVVTNGIVAAESQKASGKRNETQKVEITSGATGGTFTLTWNPGGGPETTTSIAYNATAATVRTALGNLTTPDINDFQVAGPSGGPWSVNFGGTYASTDVNLMTFDGSSLTGGRSVGVTTTTEGGTASDAIQTVWVTAQKGTFTLTFRGATTSTLDVATSTAASVKTALEALSTVGTGNVDVYGHGIRTLVDEFTGNTAYANALFVIRFKAQLGGAAVEKLVLDASKATIGNDDAAQYSFIYEVQKGGESGIDEWQFIDLAPNPELGTRIFLEYDDDVSTHVLTRTTTDAQGGNDVTDLRLSHVPDAIIASSSGLAAGELRVTAGSRALVDVTSDGTVRVLPQNNIKFMTSILMRFVGAKAATNVSQINVAQHDMTSGTPAASTVIQGSPVTADEVQEIKVNASGGTFTLSDGTSTTAAIAHGATAATVKTSSNTNAFRSGLDWHQFWLQGEVRPSLAQATGPVVGGSLQQMLEVRFDVEAVLGKTVMPIGEILELGTGSIVELDRLISESVDLVVQGVRVARGEVVVVDDRFAIRIKEIINPNQ